MRAGSALTTKERDTNATRRAVPGAIIGERYRLRRLLGRGGMGEVWLAEHAILRTDVALKLLSCDARTDAALVEKKAEMFRLEAQISAQLAALTPHVAKVYDAGNGEAGPYLALEYVDGRTLEDLLRAGPLEIDAVATLIDHVADALDVAHRNGVVHRDVKPSNILLASTASGSIDVKLADFSIAHVIAPRSEPGGGAETVCSPIAGTPGYMSPEQLLGASIDARTDLWSLGVVAYEALTGSAPFARPGPLSQIQDVLAGRHLAPSARRPGLTPEIDEWFERAMAPDRERRFSSAREMARAFRRSMNPTTATCPGIRLKPAAASPAPKPDHAPPSREADSPIGPLPSLPRRGMWTRGRAVVAAAGIAGCAAFAFFVPGFGHAPHAVVVPALKVPKFPAGPHVATNEVVSVPESMGSAHAAGGTNPMPPPSGDASPEIVHTRAMSRPSSWSAAGRASWPHRRSEGSPATSHPASRRPVSPNGL